MPTKRPAWLPVLFVLLMVTAGLIVPAAVVGGAPGVSLPVAGGAAPLSVTLATGPAVAPCTAAYHGFSAVLRVDYLGTYLPANNGTVYTPLEEGYVPATVNFSLAINSGSAPWTYNITFGDGTNLSGLVFVSYPGNSTGTSFVNFSHAYVLPAEYHPAATLNFTCPYGSGWMSLSAPSLLVGGPGGYQPVSVTTNVTNGSVPLSVEYNAVINDTPTNATIEWFVQDLATGQEAFYLNSTTLNLTLDMPGTEFATVQVLYPGGTLEYGAAQAPLVTVAPLVAFNLSESTTVGPNSGGQITVTFFANATNLNGTPYGGPGNITWNFTNGFSSGNFSFVNVSGPTSGNEVTENFSPLRGGNWEIRFPVLVSFVDPSGVTLGDAGTAVLLDWGAGPSYSLQLTADPNNGTAPFDTNITATAYPTIPANSSGPYELDLCVAPYSGHPGLNVSGCPVFEDNITNWGGATLTIPLTGLGPGTYVVEGTLWVPAGPNTTQPVGASYEPFIVVRNGTSVRGSPLVVSATGSPSNGTAPLATSMGVEAGGGTAPFALSVCLQGPSNTTPVSGSCRAVASSTGWNGSAVSVPLLLNQTGFYDAVATVSDANGSVTNTTVLFQVTAPAVAAPLEVQASDQPSATTAGAYAFMAAVSGGVAPYAIQWSFGDGAYGSSTAGGTVSHSYTASGSYTATLTVTDDHGTVRMSTVGPLPVTLPTTPGTSVLSGSWLGLLTGSLVVIIASLAVLVYVARNAVERRRTEAWMASVRGSPPEGPPPRGPGT